MSCRAPSRIGVIRLRQQNALGTPIALQSTDGVRVIEAPQIAGIGEGMVNIMEDESPRAGGLAPVLGSYGETFSLLVPVPVAEDGELTADHVIVRLFRACGCAVAISGGDATITPLQGGCVGLTAADRVPLTVEWAQEGGLTHSWFDCIGAFEMIEGEGGGVVAMRFVLVCKITSKIATTSLPTVTYPGQGVMLAARNAALAKNGDPFPAALRNWTLNTGIQADEETNQLEVNGIGFPMSYLSGEPTFSMTFPQGGEISAGAWAAFLQMIDVSDIRLDITGQAAARVLRIDMPSSYWGPQTMGEESGYRTDERELTLKPTSTDPVWTIVLSEQDAP